MKPRSHFGKKLAYIRKRKGLSQQDLAERAGLTKRAIAYYELESKIDFVEKMERLSNALGIRIDELLVRDEDPPYDQELVSLNPRVAKKLKQILRLNKADRAKIYEQVELLLKKDEYKNS